MISKSDHFCTLKIFLILAHGIIYGLIIIFHWIISPIKNFIY